MAYSTCILSLIVFIINIIYSNVEGFGSEAVHVYRLLFTLYFIEASLYSIHVVRIASCHMAQIGALLGSNHLPSVSCSAPPMTKLLGE